MLGRAKKIWKEVCQPKPEVVFKVIDQEKESIPDVLHGTINIEVLFVT